MKSKLYSYHSCLLYASSLSGSNYSEQDVISLCSDSTVDFWRDFKIEKLSQATYELICSNIYKHIVATEPVAYLKKKCFFHKIPLRIEKGIFIPQPDTEVLIEKATLLINEIWDSTEQLDILELGSGSGNVSLSIAHSNKNCKIVAVDVNQQALATAKMSAADLAIDNVTFLYSNLFENVKSSFDVIISNPPYISVEDYSNLDSYTRQQPLNGLVATNNGLYFYQQIIGQSKKFLKQKFLVIFEIGYNQETEIIKMLLSHFYDVKIRVFKDLNQKSRVLAFYN